MCFLIALEFENLTVYNVSPPPTARRKRRRGKERQKRERKGRNKRKVGFPSKCKVLRNRFPLPLSPLPE